jgi:hypothetical protein
VLFLFACFAFLDYVLLSSYFSKLQQDMLGDTHLMHFAPNKISTI